MFIAHLPAGYMLAHYLLRKSSTIPVYPKAVALTAMAGSVAPDLDMLYFYFIDHGQTHHHKYISHWPMLWIGLLCISVLALGLTKKRPLPFLILIFSLGGLLHMLLDSVAGDIWWLAPFVDRPYALFTVPTRFQPWWLNFFLHATFALELLIILLAMQVHRRTKRARREGRKEQAEWPARKVSVRREVQT